MWRQLPCNRVIGSRCRVKDSSARSFASEETNEKREGGRTTLTSAKEEGGEGREGGERMWQQPNWRPSLQLASVSVSLSINNWGNPGGGRRNYREVNAARCRRNIRATSSSPSPPPSSNFGRGRRKLFDRRAPVSFFFHGRERLPDFAPISIFDRDAETFGDRYRFAILSPPPKIETSGSLSRSDIEASRSPRKKIRVERPRLVEIKYERERGILEEDPTRMLKGVELVILV